MIASTGATGVDVGDADVGDADVGDADVGGVEGISDSHATNFSCTCIDVCV